MGGGTRLPSDIDPRDTYLTVLGGTRSGTCGERPVRWVVRSGLLRKDTEKQQGLTQLLEIGVVALAFGPVDSSEFGGSNAVDVLKL
jgi:hypothetical protein